ncbi:hypothetical protein ACJJTC_008492 [Scirpophaga incertulas]
MFSSRFRKKTGRTESKTSTAPFILKGNSLPNLALCRRLMLYAPTADCDDQELEEFYKGIKELLKSGKSQDVNIIMRDLNAKVGQGEEGKIVGKIGLGIRNDRRNRNTNIVKSTLMRRCQTMCTHISVRGRSQRAGSRLRSQFRRSRPLIYISPPIWVNNCPRSAPPSAAIHLATPNHCSPNV